MLKLKVFNYHTGEFKEKAIELSSTAPETLTEGECVIGRTINCDLVLASPDVSRAHGRIKFQDNSYYYTDLGSANGTQVNNNPVSAGTNAELKLGDMLRIGDFVVLVEELKTGRAIELPSTALPSTALPSSGRIAPQQNGSNGKQAQWTKGQLRCVRVTDETPDVKTFTFVAESSVLFHYKPGQFMTLELEINGELVSRSYSISSSPSRPQTVEITVKRVAAEPPHHAPGLVSNWLHDHLQVGHQIEVNGILGKFTCLPEPAPKLLLISAGSGITPVMSMARWLADTAMDIDIVFIHCARTPRDIIFRQELEMMAARLPNFHLAISTTRVEPGLPWFSFTGRLTSSMLQVIAPDFQERTVYVCGPDGFMQGTKMMLEHLDFPMQNYFQESFGAPKKGKMAQKEAEPLGVDSQAELGNKSLGRGEKEKKKEQDRVVFSLSGKEGVFAEVESILELAEQEGVKIRSNCRQGVCGACKKRKLEGEVRYESEPEALEPDELAAGFILTCVACPMGRVVIEA
jgi:glycine betaine catabolism B